MDLNMFYLIFTFQVANSVFCTIWDPEITQKQVESAWTRLKQELKL